MQISTNGLFRIASTCWNIVTLINITFEEDIRKPILFIPWALRQLPGLARSAANRVFEDMEGAGNDLESLSWEVLWVAVDRIEAGIAQVITFLYLESHDFEIKVTWFRIIFIIIISIMLTIASIIFVSAYTLT